MTYKEVNSDKIYNSFSAGALNNMKVHKIPQNKIEAVNDVERKVIEKTKFDIVELDYEKLPDKILTPRFLAGFVDGDGSI